MPDEQTAQDLGASVDAVWSRLFSVNLPSLAIPRNALLLTGWLWLQLLSSVLEMEGLEDTKLFSRQDIGIILEREPCTQLQLSAR